MDRQRRSGVPRRHCKIGVSLMLFLSHVRSLHVATELRPSLPIIDHTPAPYNGPSREEVLALRHQYLSPGIITYYREPLMIVEGPHAVRVGRDGPAVSGCVCRHRHDQRRPLPSEDRRAGPRADGQAAAHDDDLSAPDDRAVGGEAGRENAGRADAVVLHQQRQRGERDRDPLGPRVHGQPGRDRAAQRLPRRHVGADEPHGARQRGSSRATTARTSTTRCPAIATAARSGSSIRPAA